MNKFLCVGNISTDIEVRKTNNDKTVANFNIALNDRDNTVFMPVEVWNNQAINLEKYQSKGSKIAIDGSIKVDEWEKDGQKRSRAKILAFSIEYLDSKKGNQMNQNQADDLANKLGAEGTETPESELPF